MMHFTHPIDRESFYCTGCGRFLADLQRETRWIGNEVHPVCVSVPGVIVVSHLVRRKEATL